MKIMKYFPTSGVECLIQERYRKQKILLYKTASLIVDRIPAELYLE